MRDVTESEERIEKQVINPPEREIETFDEISAKGSDRIETFDDIARKTQSRNTIETFDDIAGKKEKMGLNENRQKVGSDALLEDGQESNEGLRLGKAAEEIKTIEKMDPENWKTSTDNEKRNALEYCGRALGDAYRSPEPPLFLHRASPQAQGTYGDGFSFDSASDRVSGAEYGITMNQEAIAENDAKLFGDNPKNALKTYAHEFRHSYQNEQAHAFEKGLKVENPEQAKEWSENLKNYVHPPKMELKQTDKAKFDEKYQAYRNQPVEADARNFGEKVLNKVYDTNEKKL